MTVPQVTHRAPPRFLQLAGHPLRWGLLVELAHSDLQVHELTGLLGQPQGLVSYHLARLRTEGLVSSRRSSLDGRAAYYCIDIDRCRELLAAVGTSLHPALSAEPASSAARTHRSRRARVLFVCTGNSARSQIAEALLERVAGDRLDVHSAGSHPKPVHPNAVKVLSEHGIDISTWRSKHLDEFTGQRFDYVVTLCDKVRERCPEFGGGSDRIHWSIEDPSRTPGTDRTTYPVFRTLAANVRSRVEHLVAYIDQHNQQEHHRHAR